MSKRRWWVWIALGVVAAVVAAVGVPESAIDVETATVARSTITVSVDQEGRTRLRDRYVVAAPVTGRLDRVAVDEGDRVSTGDLVARIYPTPVDPRAVGVARGQVSAADARRLEAAAQLEQARSPEQQAQRDLDRAMELVEAGALSRAELEQAQLAATSARRQLETRLAALRAAEADVAAAQAALVGVDHDASGGAAVAVGAPGAGRVLRVFEKSARVVQAGTPLVAIGDATGLELLIDVLTEDAVRIQPGHPVLIEQWGGDAVLHGKVRLVEPEAFTEVSALGVEEQRVNVVVDLIDPPPSLGTGYRVEARIVTWRGEGVLSVPTSALFQEDGRWVVFAVQEGRAVRRTVRIGYRSAEAAEVLEGLDEGQAVIVFPSPLIADGVLVR
jgi:HlyD family secretion protein